MFDRNSSFYVFEFIDDCPPFEDMIESLKALPFVDISQTEDEYSFCYTGPDHINEEKNFVTHPARGLIGFSALYQSRKENKELIDKEFELELLNEYPGQKLSRDDLKLVKELVIARLISKFPVIQRHSDVIFDREKSRIYIRSSGDGLLFSTIRSISNTFGLANVSMRPWFDGPFIEKAQGWDRCQTLFLYWLNSICQKDNPYEIHAGTKIDLRDSFSRVKISGDHSQFGGIWDMFNFGRRIDSVEVILKERIKSKDNDEDILEDILQYRLNVKKLGFNDLRVASLYLRKVRTPSGMHEKVQSIERFLDHFDSLCLGFQSAMKSVDLKELYEKVIKTESESDKK